MTFLIRQLSQYQYYIYRLFIAWVLFSERGIERERRWNPYSLGVQRGKRLSVGSSTLPSTGSFRSAPHLSLSFLGFEWYILDLESRHLFVEPVFPPRAFLGSRFSSDPVKIPFKHQHTAVSVAQADSLSLNWHRLIKATRSLGPNQLWPSPTFYSLSE